MQTRVSTTSNAPGRRHAGPAVSVEPQTQSDGHTVPVVSDTSTSNVSYTVAAAANTAPNAFASADSAEPQVPVQRNAHEFQHATDDGPADEAGPRRSSPLPMDVLERVVSFLEPRGPADLPSTQLSLRLVSHACAEAVGNVAARAFVKCHCTLDTVAHDDEPFEPGVGDDEDAVLPVNGPPLRLSLNFSAHYQRFPTAVRDLILASRCGPVYTLTFMGCIRTLSVTCAARPTPASQRGLHALMSTFRAGPIPGDAFHNVRRVIVHAECAPDHQGSTPAPLFHHVLNAVPRERLLTVSLVARDRPLGAADLRALHGCTDLRTLHVAALNGLGEGPALRALSERVPFPRLSHVTLENGSAEHLVRAAETLARRFRRLRSMRFAAKLTQANAGRVVDAAIRGHGAAAQNHASALQSVVALIGHTGDRSIRADLDGHGDACVYDTALGPAYSQPARKHARIGFGGSCCGAHMERAPRLTDIDVLVPVWSDTVVRELTSRCRGRLVRLALHCCGSPFDPHVTPSVAEELLTANAATLRHLELPYSFNGSQALARCHRVVTIQVKGARTPHWLGRVFLTAAPGTFPCLATLDLASVAAALFDPAVVAAFTARCEANDWDRSCVSRVPSLMDAALLVAARSCPGTTRVRVPGSVAPATLHELLQVLPRVQHLELVEPSADVTIFDALLSVLADAAAPRLLSLAIATISRRRVDDLQPRVAQLAAHAQPSLTRISPSLP